MSRKCEGWCWYCYLNARKKTNRKGHYGYTAPRAPYKLKPWERQVKKPESSKTASDPRAKPCMGDMFACRPLLWEMLTESVWEDGTPRERSTFLVVMEGGTVRVWLNDRAMNRSSWGTGDSMEAALDVLEEQIATDSVPWRVTDQKKRPRQ